MIDRSRSLGPWTSRDLARLAGANVAGVVMISAGWYRAAGVGDVRTQLTWLNLSVAGLAVSGVSNALWLLRGRQAVGLTRVALLAAPIRAAPLPRRVDPATERFVTGDGMTRFHRPDCAMVRGKVVTVGTAADLRVAGRRPCEICAP